MTLLYIALGTVFGFILSRSGAADYGFIQGMFLFTELQLYKIIAVAVVVADSPYLAEDGRDEVLVEWDPQPSVGDVERALADDAPLVWQDRDWPDNVCAVFDKEIGDVDRAFEQADVVVAVELQLREDLRDGGPGCGRRRLIGGGRRGAGQPRLEVPPLEVGDRADHPAPARDQRRRDAIEVRHPAIQTTTRHDDLADEVHQHHQARGRLLCRLDHDAVTSGERRSELPRRHQ